MDDRARFLAEFLRSPFDTASITPSSNGLADAMVAEMDLAEADTVVELGPGTGVFTRAISRVLKPGARLICVEVNPELTSSPPLLGGARVRRGIRVNFGNSRSAADFRARSPVVARETEWLRRG